MKKKRINQIFSEKGQGVMEYVILSSLIGIFCLVAVKQYGDVLIHRINYMKSSLVKNISMD